MNYTVLRELQERHHHRSSTFPKIPTCVVCPIATKHMPLTLVAPIQVKDYGVVFLQCYNALLLNVYYMHTFILLLRNR